MRGPIPVLAGLSILLVALGQPPARAAADTASTQGKDWAVVIGINDYQNVRRLKYASQDATAVGDLLAQQGFTVIPMVSPKDTTRKAIERVLGTQLPKKLSSNDRVLIFFSGHGKDEQFGGGQRTGYLLPIEANPQDLAATAISMGRVRELVNVWPAKHVLFIVDSCYSGIIGENTKSIRTMTPIYREQITREKGRHLIVAGGADQEALEIAEWGQSLLTHFLLEGLGNDKTADLDADGIIPTSELYQFLDRRVYEEAQLRGYQQRPEYWSLSPGHKGEFVFPGRGEQEQPVQPVNIPTPSFSAVPSPAMVRIAPGSFMMKSEPSQSSGRLSFLLQPGPVHKVHITKPFAIARYETTFDEYDRFARAAGRPLPEDKEWGRGSRPVINVSWDDANAYAQWLSQQTGNRYRLPTEAEWEYAASSGGEDEVWAGTSDESQLKQYAVYDTNRTGPVGSKKPNGLGLYDMTGNVSELLEDCWHDNYKAAPSNGSAWLEANGDDCGERVIRGGSWFSGPEYLRVSNRTGLDAGSWGDDIGFRLAQDLEP
ncbi:MAG: SUMF1/EgtB/PvdO family nonheme iron enzyme [Nitrospira sp.]|nr:SUMF1/EgtB/PvdO family nonheme iron enzyme [Nitrospira sp.]